MANFGPPLSSGPDTLNRISFNESDNITALAGNDLISTGAQNDTVVLNEGSDSLFDTGGNNSVTGGSGDDSIRTTASTGQYWGYEGADTLDATGSNGVTLIGGLDSTDAADLILGSSFNDLILGNGGADTINSGGGLDTIVGGFSGDSILGSAAADLILSNENNDTVLAGVGENTVVGGFGDDSVLGTGRSIGSEGNDTLAVGGGAGNATLEGADGNDRLTLGAGAAGNHTMSGGAGNDTLQLFSSGGNTVSGSGGDGGDLFLAVTGLDNSGFARITDLNWQVDQIDLPTSTNLDRVGNAGLRDAANLFAAAQGAINVVNGGNAALRVVAQFGFLGNTYVAVDQFGGADPEIIINITGVTGTITAGNFLT